MLGEHRQLLAELLLTKKSEFGDDLELVKMIRDQIKSLEDVTSKAKNILMKQSIKGGGIITDAKEDKFMRIIFSYHPTRVINSQSKISVGICQGQPTFFIADDINSEQNNEKDAISIKKCAIEISTAFSVSLKDYAEKKYTMTPLKRVA